MESAKIELLLEKYFEGETSIIEEQVLKTYFCSSNVAQHLSHYQSLFGYFEITKQEKTKHELSIQPKRNKVLWLSIAASVVVLLSVGTFPYFNYNTPPKEDLGSFDTPEEAFIATQKALTMLSENVKVGVKSVQYINEYEVTKAKVFVGD